VRLRLDVAYDGTEFSGWARQPDQRTVQGELESALAVVLREPAVRVVCAGRTDAGVHARGQVCHVDVEAGTQPSDLLRRLAGVLPGDVRVRAVTAVPDEFDARFAATWRRYAYRVRDRLAAADPLRRGEVLTWPRSLDLDAMNVAARPLLGTHDFSAFCKRREGATSIRTLRALEWQRDDTGLAVCSIVADAFCHNMVRALVGGMLSVGEGARPVDWLHDVLVRGERDPGVRVVPAYGLTLEEVGYPDDEHLAERVEQTKAVRAMP
jgi:tRNA pseudouridine38-40 synthase